MDRCHHVAVHICILPGTSRDTTLTGVTELANSASNLRGLRGTAEERLDKYLRWTTDTSRMLRNFLTADYAAQLVYTPGYSRIVSATPLLSLRSGVAAINGLLSSEMELCVERLNAFKDSVMQQFDAWSGTDVLVVLDTNIFIEYPKDGGEDVRFDARKIDYGGVLDEYRFPLRIVLPIAVVDELDRLKQSGDAHAKWRARHALGVLDESLIEGPRGVLADEDPSRAVGISAARPIVTVEILLDPPGHIRLPITDDEIIDRAVAIQTMSGRTVRLVTYDTGMATRARHAGLTVVKLTIEPGPEPQPRPQKEPRSPNDRRPNPTG